MSGFGRMEIELMQALCIYNIYIEYYSVVKLNIGVLYKLSFFGLQRFVVNVVLSLLCLEIADDSCGCQQVCRLVN